MENKGQKQIAGAILIVGILIAGAILLRNTDAPTGHTPEDENMASTTWQGRLVSVDDHIVGNLNAEIIIVEYSDFECPFCKTFHSTMQRVVDDSEGRVAWVYRHFPIPQLHTRAMSEAEASECAWEQGGNDAFWKYTNRLFEITPSNDGLDPSELPKIAQFTGLDVATFETCLSSGRFTSKVQADINDGINAGVNGTPSSFILHDGELVGPIPGNQPYATIIQMLSQVR